MKKLKMNNLQNWDIRHKESLERRVTLHTKKKAGGDPAEDDVADNVLAN